MEKKWSLQAINEVRHTGKKECEFSHLIRNFENTETRLNIAIDRLRYLYAVNCIHSKFPGSSLEREPGGKKTRSMWLSIACFASCCVLLPNQVTRVQRRAQGGFHHEYEGLRGGPQGAQDLRTVVEPLVVKHGARHLELARPVDSPRAVDEVGSVLRHQGYNVMKFFLPNNEKEKLFLLFGFPHEFFFFSLFLSPK